ncbi:MAG: hypothetical protein ACRCWM_02380 [Sarcina sp.]
MSKCKIYTLEIMTKEGECYKKQVTEYVNRDFKIHFMEGYFIDVMDEENEVVFIPVSSIFEIRILGVE